MPQRKPRPVAISTRISRIASPLLKYSLFLMAWGFLAMPGQAGEGQGVATEAASPLGPIAQADNPQFPGDDRLPGDDTLPGDDELPGDGRLPEDDRVIEIEGEGEGFQDVDILLDEDVTEENEYPQQERYIADEQEPIDIYAGERKQMVARTIEKPRDGRPRVRDPEVLEAMRTVRRHLFVPETMQPAAYGDSPLSIGHGQTISQPYIVALMTDLLDVEEGDRVLEIGTGSGYQAAVLAEIVGASNVYSIEILEPLADLARRNLDRAGYHQIVTKQGDGYQGWKEHAPFDRVIVTAAPDHVPEPLVEQLAIGGKMVIPVGDLYQELQVIHKLEQGVTTERNIPVRFVPMTGEAERR